MTKKASPKPPPRPYVEDLQRGDFGRFHARFSKRLAALLPPAKTKATWDERVARYGGLKKVEPRPRRTSAVFTCNFPQAKGVRLNLVSGKIEGLFLTAPSKTVVDLSEASASTKATLNVAKDFLARVNSGKFAAARGAFTAGMSKAVSEAALKGLWTSLQRGTINTRCALSRVLIREEALLRCASADLLMTTVQRTNGTIIGWFFEGRYRDPSYADPKTYEESEVVIGKAPWQLPGTLTKPKGAPPKAALVLVHGSGPNDRDETVAALKAFRDLALGLATRGVAVLRYDKRTRVHGRKMKGWPTLDEETTDDALHAAAYLRDVVKVPAKKIFVLGHSMGGKLIPRIGAKGKDVRGFIILAGSYQSSEDILAYQIPYLRAADDGKLSAADKKRIAQVEAQAARIRARKFKDDTPARELLGIPPKRWREWQAYDVGKSARNLRRPTLVLQGERDYQVTMKDFDGWKRALKGKKWVTFKSFPKLNHHLVTGDKKSVPAEYGMPGNVAVEVVETIARWLKAHSK